MKSESTHGPGHDALHLWFELSRAQYLTIPRSVLQSMPDHWQGEFARLLEELDERQDWRPKVGSYWCFLRDDNGRFTDDPLADYERGRRRLPLKPKRPFDWEGELKLIGLKTKWFLRALLDD